MNRIWPGSGSRNGDGLDVRYKRIRRRQPLPLSMSTVPVTAKVAERVALTPSLFTTLSSTNSRTPGWAAMASPTVTGFSPATSPTIRPTTSSEIAKPLLVYVDGGKLSAMSLEFEDGLWRAGDTAALADVDPRATWRISPNGQQVAFLINLADGSNELFVINRDGSGLRSLVRSRDLPPRAGDNPGNGGA